MIIILIHLRRIFPKSRSPQIHNNPFVENETNSSSDRQAVPEPQRQCPILSLPSNRYIFVTIFQAVIPLKWPISSNPRMESCSSTRKWSYKCRPPPCRHRRRYHYSKHSVLGFYLYQKARPRPQNHRYGQHQTGPSQAVQKGFGKFRKVQSLTITRSKCLHLGRHAYPIGTEKRRVSWVPSE